MISLPLFTLLLGAAVAHLVFLFNFTDFVVEYGKVFGLSEFVKADEYESWKTHGGNEPYGYGVFLRETYKGFFPKLLGCPYCSITFLTVIVSVFSLSPYFLLVGLTAGFVATILFLAEKTLYKKFSE